MVDAAWEQLVRWLSNESSVMRALLPLVMEAARRPQLRQLYPFTSHDTLCFSRTTGFPYTTDCPMAAPDGDGGFRVMQYGGDSLGTGSAHEAADLLVQHLPSNCGPAVDATAELWTEPIPR
jgi:hypothetical protein